MSPVLAVPKHGALGQGFTRSQRFEGDWLHPGRRTNGTQSAATWVTSLSDRRKVILLCGWCRPKFNARTNRYRPMFVPNLASAADPYVSNGLCAACKTQTALTPGGGRAYVSEETYAQVCVEPEDARRRARQAWRTGSSIGAAVQSFIHRAWGSRQPVDSTASP
jgi:hypothetical protein